MSNSPPAVVECEHDETNIDTQYQNPSAEDGGGASHDVKDAEVPRLALIPLHPAGKKQQKLEAKPIPIVLGRTNLANWWWKSCDCGHYCRLHCRPVAQNIRSLSKVMVQIDSKGVLYTVGKNPHLIAVTPQRENEPLNVNDILSIGRRDREPWMRFQVISTTDSELKYSRTKNRKPPLASIENEKPIVEAPVHLPPPNVVAIANAAANVIVDKGGDGAVLPTAQPPQWITTTNKLPTSPPTEEPVDETSQQQQKKHSTEQEQQMAVVSKLMEAAAAARPNEFAKNNEAEVPSRKRRRSRHSSGRRIKDSGLVAGKRSLTSEKGGPEAQSKSSNGFGSSNTPNQGISSEKDHHPKVHLLFQDYQTSASLVRATQRKKRRKTPGAGISRNVDPPNSSGMPQPARPFVANKNQLQLLSQNFAAALLNAAQPATAGSEVQPCSPAPVEMDVEADGSNLPATNQHTSTAPAQTRMAEETRAASDGIKSQGHSDSSRILPIGNDVSTTEQGTNTNNADRRLDAPKDVGMDSQIDQCFKEDYSIPPNAGMTGHGSNYMDAILSGTNKHGFTQDSAILSLPACQSESFEHAQSMAIGSMQGFNKGALSYDSASSPELVDPIQDLDTWRNIVSDEKAKGREFSLRSCLAKLVVIKNSNRSAELSLWIPPLLDPNFKFQDNK